ncbi:MAG: dethiobiotin synthase, partial [Rikenellaceae bacterium]
GLLDEDLDGTTAPVIFSYPASPHLAAILDHKEIDFSAIENSTKLLSSRYDTLLIEGAGGLYVPLKGEYTTADFIEEKGYPLILATSGKLGSINHTILTLEACRARSINVAVLAYNRFFDSDKIIDNDTFKYICAYIKKYHKTCEIIEVSKLNIR